MERLLSGKNDMVLIGISVGCIVIAAFLIVRIYSPRPCPAGCGAKVKDPADHTGPCKNCHVVIYGCLDTFPDLDQEDFDYHRAKCEACGQWYYTCYNPNVPKSEQDSYKHRIVSKHEDGTPIRACKPKDSDTFPKPDR